MAEAFDLWQSALPILRSRVTGVGIWAALNSGVALALEGDSFALGLPPKDSNLVGHLKAPQTARIIEAELSKRAGRAIKLRVVEGDTPAAWERVKKLDEEAQRLRDAQSTKSSDEVESSGGLYEQLSRRYAAIQNKTLAQNRARFYLEALDLVAKAANNPINPMTDRNLGRCIDRIAQYTEIPATLVAAMILERTRSD